MAVNYQTIQVRIVSSDIWSHLPAGQMLLPAFVRSPNDVSQVEWSEVASDHGLCLTRNVKHAEWRHSKLFFLKLRYRAGARVIETLHASALADGNRFNDGNDGIGYAWAISMGSLDCSESIVGASIAACDAFRLESSRRMGTCRDLRFSCDPTPNERDRAVLAAIGLGDDLGRARRTIGPTV